MKHFESIDRAKDLENESKWREAEQQWRELADARPDRRKYYVEQADSCKRLADAIERGDRLRAEIEQSMEEFKGLKEEDKRHTVWLIKGYTVKAITKDARCQVEEIFNRYPHVPRQVIIDWALKEYQKL